jgi:cell wall-associated NlpC family hydrolase
MELMRMRARRRRLLVLAGAVACMAAACGSTPANHAARRAGAPPPTLPTLPTSLAAVPAPATSTAPGAAATPSAPAPTGPKAALPRVPTLPARAAARVQVAQVWRSPSSPRSIDQPALRVPVDMRAWLATLTTAQREGLTDLVDTQVLLGDGVLVVGVQGAWANVRVPDQPHPADARGYPGWIPLAQLTFDIPPVTARVATVTALTAWLTDAGGRKVLEVSMGTRLPMRDAGSSWVEVTMPDGGALRFGAGDVSVTVPGAPALAPSADDAVRVAEQFGGLSYLWGGLSGFGVDCSGLTYMAYRMHGITIPRDSRAQATAGTSVARDALRPGDLVFFAKNGTVHHNGIYVADSTMLHAPHTGAPVRTATLGSPTYVSEYQGARRFIG